MNKTNYIEKSIRGMAWSSALLLSALLTGCGSGGGGGQDPILGAPGDIAPTVISVTPLRNAVNVPTNTPTITATFSEAMNAGTLTTSSFTLACPTGTPQTGAVTYSGTTATLTLTSNLPGSTICTATITTAAKDLTGNSLAAAYTWSFTTGIAPDILPPTVIAVTPVNGVCLDTDVTATFSEAMAPATINTSTFTLQVTGPPLVAVAGAVAYDTSSMMATFTPNSALLPTTNYTATITTSATDLAGNALVSNRVWTFTTGTLPCVPVIPPPTVGILGTASTFGVLSGTAGTTNTGILTIIDSALPASNADMSSTATNTSAVTGYHDSAGDIYTETGSNQGSVTNKIYTCTVSTTGPTAAGVNAASCAVATQARLDAQAAYIALSPAVLPGGMDPGAGQLGGLTLAPGVYKAAGGSFMITGSDLTLDAGGNANAVWVFQTASTLTVGAPAAPRSIILINGAQAKNIFWRVGTSATINGAGGGTMVGTILASSAVSFSTVGNVAIVTLDGRAVGLNASVTLTNTVINVPGP